MGKNFWSRKTFCLVTGASQGIGKQIAIDFSKKVANESAFLLLARNIENLNETKAQIVKENSSISVYTASVNFYETADIDYSQIIHKSLASMNKTANDFDLVLAVHNAGSLGDLSEFVYEMDNFEKWQTYFTLNLFSVSILNSHFLKIFKTENKEKKHEVCIINITSLCAVEPFVSMGYYCVGKASREMFFKVLAAENPDVYVLNYSPGPVLTDMTSEIINNIKNEDVKKMFLEMKNSDTIIKTSQSVSKLINVLESNIPSGKRFDFFDEIPT